MFFLTDLWRMHFRLEERQGFHHGPYYCMGKRLFFIIGKRWLRTFSNLIRKSKFPCLAKLKCILDHSDWKQESLNGKNKVNTHTSVSSCR